MAHRRKQSTVTPKPTPRQRIAKALAPVIVELEALGFRTTFNLDADNTGHLKWATQERGKERHYYAIFSTLISEVVGVTCEPNWREGNQRFVEITKHQFETYGEDPGQWTRLPKEVT